MFKLSPEAQKRVAEYAAWQAERRATFANLNALSLIASAKLYMAHCRPLDVAPGEPIYDATLWHIIVPELLRRLEENERTHNHENSVPRQGSVVDVP